MLVVEVFDFAVRVIVLSPIKRENLTEVIANWTNMVGHDIYHHPDSSGMCSIYKILETLLTSKVGVYLGPVPCLVTMEAIRSIIDNWRYPNSIETEVLDTVKVIDNSSEVSTAVVKLLDKVTIRFLAITSGKSVSDNLVNCPRFPIILGASEGIVSKEKAQESGS